MVIFMFLCLDFVLSLCPQFQKYVAKIFDFLVNHVIFLHFVTALSPRNNNYGPRFVLKNKIFKMHHCHVLSKACQNILIFLVKFGS